MFASAGKEHPPPGVASRRRPPPQGGRQPEYAGPIEKPRRAWPARAFGPYRRLIDSCLGVAEDIQVNNPYSQARRLGDLVGRCLSKTLARHGFASTELVSRWTEIVGPEIAAHAEPVKIQWARHQDAENPEPATLVLRVEGPVAIEIQHLSGLIIERVNRFFGSRAISRIALRQAPLIFRHEAKPVTAPNPERTAAVEATLTDVADANLRQALARLGAAIKRT